MKATMISSCHIGPSISTEQFIGEHFFLYLIAGTISAYDGDKAYHLKAGDYGMARRNYLVKYNKQYLDGQFEKVTVSFDQAFLQSFHAAHPQKVEKARSADALIQFAPSKLIENFIQSLTPYFNEQGAIDKDFFNIKRSELLTILLRENPGIANIFFDFGNPEKIDLEAFMNRNYKFNVALKRFAYLTGRSLTSFKKDFEKIFGDTPSRWLVQKRLQEAHFLMEKKGRKASDVYLEVGFENLSHFSFAFKKQFGIAPTQLLNNKKV